MDTLCKKLFFFAMALALGQSAMAQEKVSKKIEKTYALTNAGELRLENKYGNINLFGWEKDEVSVSINITVNHKKRENAEDLLKRISPVMHNNGNYVSISYAIAEKSNSFFSNLFDKANLFDFDRSNIQVDFTVYMPSKAKLQVKNTFGDVIIEDWAGKLKADVEHGDLWINEDLDRVDIDLKYGKLRAQNIDYGTISLINGSFVMANAKNLKITSSGTDIEIDKVMSLELYSNKDEATLEEVGTLFGNLKFTRLEVYRLGAAVEMTMKIADFRVSKILNADANIAIEQESSEISLNITGFAHQFDATLEEGLVRLPKSFENVDSKMLDKGKRIRAITATYGKNRSGKISITGKKGAVLLKEDFNINPTTKKNK